jgi:hypothetical protein
MPTLNELRTILPLLTQGVGQTQSTSTANTSIASTLLGSGGTDPLSLLSSLGGIPRGGLLGSGLSGDIKKLLPLLLLLGGSGSGGSGSLLLLLILLKAKKATPPAPSLYTSFGVNLEDANKVVNAASNNNTEGMTKAELDTYIGKTASTTKEGKIARFFRGLFDLVAFQKGNIYRLGTQDLLPFAKLDGQNDKIITATEIAGEAVTPDQAKKVLDYIKNNQDKLNEFGDAKNTTYPEGARPTKVKSGNIDLILVGPNGDKGVFDPVAYYIAKNPTTWERNVGITTAA